MNIITGKLYFIFSEVLMFWFHLCDFTELVVMGMSVLDISRPTKPISWWEGCKIMGGRDERAGGTWLACTREGKLAFLTNVLELNPVPEAKSRGDLPVRFLESSKSPLEFAEEVAEEADQYNGFNLILTDFCSKAMVYISNRPKGKPVSIEVVSPGIHVLSNARLDSPWHKVRNYQSP
uniref:Transport and Golgi organization 2 homolog n=1 Tax=Nelumbo nucifera TaxID=4432 RepID=A0A822ZEI8_NELNU|nr:TPA_asm: hypothetical protein HUJ06_016148 [Nelumbo nucifera]